MPINKLKTSTALEKEELILELLDGEPYHKCIERLNGIIDLSNTYLDDSHLSQDARCHWIENLLVSEDLLEHFHRLLREALDGHIDSTINRAINAGLVSK